MKAVGRKQPPKLADQLPINTVLWKHAIGWIKGFEIFEDRPHTKEEFKRLVREFYFDTVRNCKNEEDLKEIIKDWEKRGYLPKGSYSGKWPSKIRNRRKTA